MNQFLVPEHAMRAISLVPSISNLFETFHFLDENQEPSSQRSERCDTTVQEHLGQIIKWDHLWHKKGKFH